MMTEVIRLSISNEQFNTNLTKEIIFQPKLPTGLVAVMQVKYYTLIRSFSAYHSTLQQIHYTYQHLVHSQIFNLENNR